MKGLVFLWPIIFCSIGNTATNCKSLNEMALAQCELRESFKERISNNFDEVKIAFYPNQGKSHPKSADQQFLGLESLRASIVQETLQLIGDKLNDYNCSDKYRNLEIVLGRIYLRDIISFDKNEFKYVHNSSYSPIDILSSIETDLRLFKRSQQTISANTYVGLAEKNSLKIDLTFGTNRLGALSIDEKKLSENVKKVCQ